MDLDPDHSSARGDQEALRRLLLSAVEKAGLPGPPPELSLPLHPAAVEAARLAGREHPLAPERAAELARQLGEASAALPPEAATGPVEWPVEQADPDGLPHLRRAVARSAELPPTAALGRWRPADRAVFASAVRLLDAVWPRMLGELRATVAQVALLDGAAVDGHIDAAVRGAVLIGRRVLSPTPAGLPASVRLAETLVYEGTRSRCAAAVAAREPFPAAEEDGACHRAVGLARCVLLYERLLGAGPAAEPAMEERYGRLRAELGTAAGGGRLLARIDRLTA
ncbi:hypothetical protein AB0H73_15565 [Streptomyces olivoreticuli]|uniref:hypothetical protein n=1 Tax=Streptomyces olivoreticuli TaxID=68246 RepID=UPI000E2296DD|nr:hypothetical protein [Streptomyces olivoreticuli]